MMESVLCWILLIAACMVQGILHNHITLSSTKEVILENSSVALTCSNKTETLEDSQWRTSLYDNQQATCYRAATSCVKTSFLNNITLFDCICNDNGSFTVLLKHVDRYQHGSNWTCRKHFEISNTFVINVSVPVTHAILTRSGNELMYENTSASFTCSSSYSLPSAQIHWYRSYSSSIIALTDSRNVDIKRETHTSGDNVIRVTEILSYRVNRSVNSWSVYCTATNWESNIVTSETIMLSVIYPPDMPPVIDGLSNGSTFKVIENEKVNLSCSVKGGNPLAQLEWHCEHINSKPSNERITNNETVTFCLYWMPKRTDGKTCTCQTVHVLSNVSIYVNVDVLYPPEIPVLQLQHLSESKNVTSDIKVIEHKSYRLLCMADANPPSEFIWHGPQTAGISYNSLIDFNDVDRTQSGTYICHARNIMRPKYGESTATENNNTVNLDILFKPTLAVINRQAIAEGSTLNITCEVISANPSHIDHTWTRDTSDFRRNSKELLLHNVSRHDAMNYTCTVKNYMKPTVGEDEEGYASETFNLNVWYGASVKRFVVIGYEQDEHVIIKESDKITLTCEIDSNPESTVKIITPNGTEIISTGTNVFEYKHFTSSCVDNGTYTCYGSNDYNYGNPGLAKLTLFVKCTPMAFTHIETDKRSKLYVPVTLQFRAVAYPEPDFTWEKWINGSWEQITNDNMFSVSSHNLQSYLTVINFTTTIANAYRLLVVNEIGSLVQNYTRKPADRPGTPKEFRDVEQLLTDTSVTLVWKPGFNGGISQTFIIMYTDEKGHDLKHIVIQDTGNTVMNLTIHGLSIGTSYMIKLLAVNSEGSSGSVTLQIKTKNYSGDTQGESSPVTGIVIGVISLLVLGIAIAVYILRRRYQRKSHSSNEERTYDNLKEMTTVSGRKQSLVPEPVYEGLRTDTERRVDKRTEQAYDILQPEQGRTHSNAKGTGQEEWQAENGHPGGAEIQTYTNLKF